LNPTGTVVGEMKRRDGKKERGEEGTYHAYLILSRTQKRNTVNIAESLRKAADSIPGFQE
jgi:hypothetical protein